MKMKKFEIMLFVLILAFFQFSCSDSKNPLNGKTADSEGLAAKKAPNDAEPFDLQSYSCFSLDDLKLIGSDGSERLYEDAEDGLITPWYIGGLPGNQAKIWNSYDSYLGSRVINFYDDGNIYWFHWGSWYNSAQKEFLEFKFKARSTEYCLRVVLLTTDNQELDIRYEPKDTDGGLINWSKPVIFIGLGSNTSDNTWRTISRNLEDDINKYLPDIKIAQVVCIGLRGPCTPPETPNLDARTIGFWKNNILKAIEGKTNGVQVSAGELNALFYYVNRFYLAPFNDIDFNMAYEILSASDSDPIALLKKQLLAAEFNFFAGAYIDNNKNLTEEKLKLGEDYVINPSLISSSDILELKDLLDDFNNSGE